MIRLTIYGDFNCPFSALASARADRLLATGRYEIDWRAVQHDPAIALAGEEIDGEVAAGFDAEVAQVRELSKHDLQLNLIVPPVRSNTGAASEAFAAADVDRHEVRRRVFAAVWVEGHDIGDPRELARLGINGRDADTAQRWQDDFGALPRPLVPSLVLPDGYVSRGLGALARLAELATAQLSS